MIVSRNAEGVRRDILATTTAIERTKHQADLLRRRLGRVLTEARDHPDLTLEEARQLPEKPIPRETANRLIREAGTPNAAP